MRPRRDASRIAISVATLLACAGGARAQTIEDLSEPVRTALSVPYLTAEEAADLRVFHGVWTEDDLASPRRRAMAALIVGAWDDPVFADARTPAVDRAEAMFRRGDLELALATLEGEQSTRARRIRAEALAGLGQMGEADAAIQPVVESLQRRKAESAEELVELVRALRLRASLRGGAAEDFHMMMGLLAQARDEMDRLYWPAKLVEAQLLTEKDNRGQAAATVDELLTMNPASADGWAMRAEMSVDGFQFDNMERAADFLDRLQTRIPGRSGEPGASTQGNLARSRAWMRQNEPDRALEALAPTLAQYPTQRQALALRCAGEAMKYDEARTERLLAEFDALSPGSNEALLAVGRALAEARQYASAAEYLRRAIERLPNSAEGWIDLGLLSIQSGEDLKARDALSRAVELDPFNVRADNSLRLITELLTYDEIESEHFIVRYKPGVDEVMAVEMLPVLERIHDVVAGELQHSPPFKTVIELMPDHRWFAVRITGMPAIHTIAAATGPLIAMEAPKIGPNHSGDYDWARVVQHEYTHTVTLSRTRNRIPHWFTEASAVHMEHSPRDFNTAQMLAGALQSGELFDMRKINIAFVRPEKPTDRAQAYAQGHWMYEFIIDHWGAEAPLQLMDLYAEGLREDEAMRSVLGVSQEEFFEMFKPWARTDAATWGLLPEPTMAEILLAETLADEAGRAGVADSLTAFARSASAAIAGFGALEPASIDFVELTDDRLDALIAQYEGQPDLLRIRADRALEANKGEVDDEAALWLERYAAARPVDDEPHRVLARHYLKGADSASIRKAVEHLKYLDQREQQSSAYAAELARRLLSLREAEEASRYAERATQIAPFDPGLRELAATAALQRRDLATAERHIAALVELEPDRVQHQQRLEAVRRMLSEQG